MVDTLIKVTILLAVVAAAAYVLRRRSASIRHLLWALAIVGLIALPVLTRAAPFRLPILPSFDTVARETPRSAGRGGDGSAREISAQRADAAEQPLATPSPSESSIDDAANPVARTSPLRVAAMVWLVGVAILLTRFGVGVMTVRRIARRATPITDHAWRALADRSARALGLSTPVELRRSDDVVMPFATGLATPIVVLPSASIEWSPERGEAVLMHEMAHINRGDLAMNMVSHVVSAVYWFHPLAWFAVHRLRVEGERSCDDAVLRAGARPSDYAEHLLNIVRTAGNPVPGVALAMARRSDFEGRLLAILEPGVPRARLTRTRGAGVAALFVAVVLTLAAVAPVAAHASAVAPKVETRTLQVPQAPEQSAATIAALIETLDDASPVVRVAAVSSLGSLGDPKAIAALAKALREDTDARVREAAAHSLGEIDDNRAVPALLDALKTERVANVRVKIIEALGEIDDPSAAPGVVAALKDASVAVRRAAVEAVGELNDRSAVPALLTMLHDSDAEVRRQVAQALGQLEEAAAIDGLIGLARDGDVEVRRHAVQALSQFEDQRSLPALLTALKDSDADVRQHAADAIGNLHDELKAVPRPLIDALSDPDAEVRHNAAHAVGNIGDPVAVPALKKLTSDTDTEVRQAAAEALSEIGGVEALQALMGLLKDTDPEIRKIAAEALGKKRR